MTSTHTSESGKLKDAYRRVKDKIAAAATRAGRSPNNVLMLAVTKTASPDQIRQLVEMGHQDLGENRVQQLVQRVANLEEFLSRRRSMGQAATRAGGAGTHLPDTVRWHMIGTLQRNKVKQVVPAVQLIHSVDSLRLAEELHNYAVRHEQVVDILIQVNASGEITKHGVAAPAVIHLAEQIDSMMHLRLRGLMTMAPYVDDPEASRPAFARTQDIFEDIKREKIAGDAFTVLSMGMTNDYEVAIQHGANLVRIGRALFGDEEQG
jgi:pyridoxal phosphate enzyme (YggS family)